jgi:predicted SprT family Zn-dependent metalloprotease
MKSRGLLHGSHQLTVLSADVVSSQRNKHATLAGLLHASRSVTHDLCHVIRLRMGGWCRLSTRERQLLTSKLFGVVFRQTKQSKQRRQLTVPPNKTVAS